ncbi:MAG: aminotransferase class III-fold pyridoxal phosphate-dependent enzyme, partial [Acetobacteraceae bacterium]|nr:aminotransferase class III-fold pyridoxal phosphate-dependent enzyme [Acetobacteraceae bacterium]
VKNIETTIQGEGPESVAAVLIEPMLSGIGVAVPPDEYLPEVEKLCRKYGLLLHIDEVINGFGRTGKMFGYQHYNVTPDIIAIAKGISSAYMPIAATMIRDNVFKTFYGDPSENRQVVQVNTYGGHAAAAAVALRNIEIIEQEQLVQRSADVGAYLLEGLRGLLSHPVVGDVRGKGLLAAVELVQDRQTKQPLTSAQLTEIVDDRKAEGVIIGRGSGANGSTVIVLSPPLVITRAECDRIVSTLDRALSEVALV